MSLVGFVCPACQAGRPSPAATCPTCGWTQSRANVLGESLFRLSSTPDILVTAQDHRSLSRLVSTGTHFSEEISRFLSSELQRAQICEAKDIPQDIVTMNSRVLFQVDWLAGMYSRILSYPETYVVNGQFISIASPVGVALIGLREGDRMPFHDLHGNQCSVTLVSVMFRPATNQQRLSSQPAAPEDGLVRTSGSKGSRKRSARILPS